jgi:hypothetical protein
MSPVTTPWEKDAAGGASSGGDVNRFPMPFLDAYLKAQRVIRLPSVSSKAPV